MRHLDDMGTAGSSFVYVEAPDARSLFPRIDTKNPLYTPQPAEISDDDLKHHQAENPHEDGYELDRAEIQGDEQPGGGSDEDYQRQAYPQSHAKRSADFQHPWIIQGVSRKRGRLLAIGRQVIPTHPNVSRMSSSSARCRAVARAGLGPSGSSNVTVWAMASKISRYSAS